VKHIKKYKLFEAALVLTKEQISFLDEYTDGTWSINKEGFVDINGSFICIAANITDFKGIQFGTIKGDFICARNKLTSLEGAPQEIGGHFNCSNNKLTSLKGAPKESTGAFICYNNKLTSLKGSPQEVGNFDCHNNKLTSLEGAPQEVGHFICSRNKLISLKGAPQKINNVFHSDFFICTKGEWTPSWIVENINKYPILMTIATPKFLQEEIDKNPGKMIRLIKSHWNKLKKKPEYKSVKFPDNFKKTITVAANLADIGL